MSEKKKLFKSFVHQKLKEPESNRLCLHVAKRLAHKQTVFTSKANILFFVVFFLLSTQYTTDAKKLKNYKEKMKMCRTQLTSWSKCSKSCDMGVSFRTKNTPKCRVKKEKRLCTIRPCNKARFMPKSKKSKCLPMIRQRERLSYVGAQSLRRYNVRYCGVCRNALKCCTPVRVKTRNVKFRMKSGRMFRQKVAFIKKCRCHWNCPAVLPAGTGSDLHQDTNRNRKKTLTPQKPMSLLIAVR